jgi:hypothetical protein
MPYYASGSHGRGKELRGEMSIEELKAEIGCIPNMWDILVKQEIFAYPKHYLFTGMSRGHDLVDARLFPDEKVGVYITQAPVGIQTPLSDPNLVEVPTKVGVVRNGNDYGKEMFDKTAKKDVVYASIEETEILERSVRIKIRNGQRNIEEIVIQTED